MSKPTGWIVRPRDMKALQHELNRVQSNTGDLWVAARTLVGWAEPQQTQLPPVSVVSLALPLDEIVCACGETVTFGHSHPCPLDEPVNVPADPDVEPQPYDMPSPEADALVMRAYADMDVAAAALDAEALSRIAEAYLADLTVEEALSEIGRILRETRWL